MKSLPVQLRRVAAVAGLWISMAGPSFGQAAISTVAGTGVAGFDPSDEGGPATQAELTAPYGVFVDAAGNLFIVDQVNYRIRKVDTAGRITTVAGAGGPFVGDFGDGHLATAAYLNSPRGVCVDEAGNIYISDWLNHRIRKVGTDGIISTIAGSGPYGPNQGGYEGDNGPAIQARLNYPVGICLDQAGNLYIADSRNNRIRQVDANGVISTVAGTGTRGYSGDDGPAVDAELSDPADVYVDGNDLYIADSDNNVIRKVNLLTGVISTFAGHGPGAQDFNNPTGVVVDRDGNAYVSDELNSRVRKVDRNGVITTIAGTGVPGYSGDGGPAENAQLNMPSDVAVDAAGALYISDWMANVVRRVGNQGRLDLEINQGYVLANGVGESQMGARLLDNSGQLRSADNSTAVSFEVIQGVASISGPNPAISSGGVASSSVGRTSTAGMVVVRATAAGFAADADTIFAVSDRKLRLTIARDYLLADGIDESQMRAELLDQDNQVIFTEDRTQVSFSVSGPASAMGANPVTVQRGVALSTLRAQTQEGLAVVTATAEGFASSTASVMVRAANQPPLADAGPDQTAECTGPLTSIILSGAASSDPDGEALSYSWSENGAEFSTLASPILSLARGTHTIALTVSDPRGGTSTDEVIINLVDTTPPALTLNGSSLLLLELGTPYAEPGASASDLVDGDLTSQVQRSGAVNAGAEGAYTLTYTVSDAAHNSTSASRTVRVVVTPNSYGLIATHSMHLRQSAQVRSGFAGVVNQGQRPFLAGKVELVVGTKVQTGEDVRLSAPRVQVRQSAAIAGELVYAELVSVGKKATIARQTQVPASYFPLFQGIGLPTFLASSPGTQDVEVRQKGSATLAAGAYDEVRVKQRGTLIFSGGTYHLGDLEVGPNAQVLFLAPATLLLRGQLALDQNSTFGPASGAGIGASDILVYVEGKNGRLGNHHDDEEGDDEEDDAEGRQLRQSPRAAKIGVWVSFQGNLYAPNGTIHLRQGSACVGSFIGRDIIVGVRAQVVAQSGWNTPGVVYQPQAPLPKPAGEQHEAAALPGDTGLLANYPNPFNPSTTVAYVLAEAGQVKLSVYNVLGQQIRALVDQLQVPGTYVVSWDGMDAAGEQVAGGVYFCRLEAGEQVRVRKILLTR